MAVSAHIRLCVAPRFFDFGTFFVQIARRRRKICDRVPDADGWAKVPLATTVPVPGICKVVGKTAKRNYSSRFSHVQSSAKGLTNFLTPVPIATTIPV